MSRQSDEADGAAIRRLADHPVVVAVDIQLHPFPTKQQGCSMQGRHWNAAVVSKGHSRYIGEGLGVAEAVDACIGAIPVNVQ